MTKRIYDYDSHLLQLFQICKYSDFGEYSASPFIWHLKNVSSPVETLI